MKKFISGLIIGIMITISIGAFAEGGLGDLVIKHNPFPIIVNGTQEDVEAYNIDGFTFLKIADIARALDNAVDVKFDEVKREINISTIKMLGAPEVIEDLIPKEEEEVEDAIARPHDEFMEIKAEEYMKDGIRTIMYEGKEYSHPTSIGYHMGVTKGYNKASIVGDDNEKWHIIKDQTSQESERLDDIPYIKANGGYYIDLDYYYEVILPFLE